MKFSIFSRFGVVGGVCLVLLFHQLAYADLVTFEDQPAGPSTFAAAGPTQTLTYAFSDVTAVFSGGVILTNEASQTTDFSNVYATCNLSNFVCNPTGTLVNPLTVTFSAPIQNFQIQILNAIAGTYTMSDNVGDSTTFTLATTGGSIATEGFAAAGTQVTIESTTPNGFTGWDFAIDNVTFNQALGCITDCPSVPEPSSLLLLGCGLIGMFVFRKKIVSGFSR